MSELLYDIRNLKTFRDLSPGGEQPWFIGKNWDGNNIHIVDKNDKKLFTMSGDIRLATYICMLNNKLNKFIKEVEKNNE